MTAWNLPVSADIGGRKYEVNADYRDVLEVIGVLQDVDKNDQLKVYVALSLFYEDFEAMPAEDYEEALRWLFDFIALGEDGDGTNQPKVFDWEQDALIIVAEINKVAGVEIRNMPFLHWWTFIAYFNGIGEGQLSFVVSLREKIRKGQKLEKHEREYYRHNRSRVDLKIKTTKAEDEILDKWMNIETR